MTRFIAIIPIAVMLLLPTAQAQVDTTLYRSWSAAVMAGDQGYDPSMGLELTTRSILRGRLCLRLKGNVAWMEAYRSLYQHTAAYHLMEAMAVYQFSIVEHIRPYMEAGLIEVLPSAAFSSLSSIDGFGCRVGVEMFIVARPGFHVAYYFAGSWNCIDAVAEKLDTHPHYAEGIGFGTGLRFYLKGAR